jgi:hypothetical protein
MGCQWSILVDPFSPLYYQGIAWCRDGHNPARSHFILREEVQTMATYPSQLKPPEWWKELSLAVPLVGLGELFVAGIRKVFEDWTDVGRIRLDDLPLILVLAGILLVTHKLTHRRSAWALWLALLIVLAIEFLRNFAHVRSLM